MTASKTWHAITHHVRNPRSFLHRFSDSGLHGGLMIAVVILVGLALYEAVTWGVAVWQLDTVVVQGQAKR